MKRIVFVLMAVAAIVLTGCEKNHTNDVDSNPPANGGYLVSCSCDLKMLYNFNVVAADIPFIGTPSDYKVYASGSSNDVVLTLYYGGENYPFVAHKETMIDEAYCFWRCKCGRYHKMKTYYNIHTEIPSGQQPEEWNRFNYLWE